MRFVTKPQPAHGTVRFLFIFLVRPYWQEHDDGTMEVRWLEKAWIKERYSSFNGWEFEGFSNSHEASSLAYTIRVHK